MTSNRCHASLAIYAREDREGELGERLNASPTRVGERHGTFSWIYSTQDAGCNGTVEDHLQRLHEKFESVTGNLARVSAEGCEIRIWIYLGLAEVNHAFVVGDAFVKWIASFGADICVDAWGVASREGAPEMPTHRSTP